MVKINILEERKYNFLYNIMKIDNAQITVVAVWLFILLFMIKTLWLQ